MHSIRSQSNCADSHIDVDVASGGARPYETQLHDVGTGKSSATRARRRRWLFDRFPATLLGYRHRRLLDPQRWSFQKMALDFARKHGVVRARESFFRYFQYRGWE